MAWKRIEWPEVGDFVMATVERITSYGAYVLLDEYDKEGLLHISEVSTGWVRNIRSFVREGQKVVLKVLRVDPEKGHVDLSLKRVTKRDRRVKILSWRQDRKANGILRNVSEKLEVPLDELYEKAGRRMDKLGGVYKGLEKTVKEGAEVLLEIGVPKEIAETLTEISKERISIPMVKAKGILELKSIKPNGVTLIRETLLNAQKIEKNQGGEIYIYVVAPPRYRIEVLAEDYKKAERILQKAVETSLKTIKKAGGQGTFIRER